MSISDDNWVAGPGGYQLQGWTMERLAADPSTNVFLGRTYFNTATNKLRTYNGTSWDEYSVGSTPNALTQAAASSAAGKLKVSAAADRTVQDSTLASTILMVNTSSVVVAAVAGTDYVTAASTNAFTNKTFDATGTGNTLSNVGTANFASTALNTSGTLAGATATQVPTALATQQAIAAAVSGVAKPMGGIDASTNPNYPAANAGEFYRVTVAGLIGGASGIAVQVGDELHCFVTSAAGTQAVVGANWTIVQANVDQATTTVLGLVALATPAETVAKTVTNKAVTPSDLVSFPTKFAATYGDGTATSFTITHNLNSLDVISQVRDASTNEVRYPRIVNATVNTITIGAYLTAPAANSMRVTITG